MKILLLIFILGCSTINKEANIKDNQIILAQSKLVKTNPVVCKEIKDGYKCEFDGTNTIYFRDNMLNK